MIDEQDSQGSRGWKEYTDIALRRRRWILFPLFFCWLAVWGLSWLLPSSYQSEALILVEQQKVPDQYVVPNVTLNLQARVQTITQQVLSRTLLQQTIDRFHLYPPHRGISGGMKGSDQVDQMRNDIKIDLVDSPGHAGDFAAFKIRYSAGTPELARQVNRELTSMFVNESIIDARTVSENTTSFLENQLADARTKMEEQEAKVAAFKAHHVGDLPTQLESNVQILAGIQTQLTNTQQALDAARQQRIYLQSLLQQYQTAESNMGGGDSDAVSLQTLDKQISDMQSKLADLHSHYTDNHPDIIALKDAIAKAEKQKQQLEGAIAARPASDKSIDPDMVTADGMQHGSPTAMMQVQSQLKANQVEIQNYEKHEKDLETQNATYQSRLNLTPQTEQELTEISRGYEESKANYNSLLQKQLQSQLATHLEQRQQGQQFRIIDTPNLPAKPSSPNHLLVSLGGLAFGAVVGLCLTAFLELTDVRVRQEHDLDDLVPAPVLIGIPRLSTPQEDRSRVVNRWLEIGLASAMALIIAVGNLFAFYKG